VEQFARLRRAVRDFVIGIGGVQFIEAPDGFTKARRIGNLGEEQFVATHADDIKQKGRAGQRR
jgi:hypothetical protein